MSHIFMDGGGHDHGGHGHGGGGHGHGGHGGGTYGNSFIVADGSFLHHDKDEVADYVKQINPGQPVDRAKSFFAFRRHGNSFLSHLMGVEQEQLQTNLLNGKRPPATNTHVPTWMLALGSMKFSHLFQGMVMKQSMWFFILFASLTGWLFVEYWIRHHEPFANSVVGSTMPHTKTTSFDRKMMQHCVGATFVRTSPEGQNLYVPLPGGTNTTQLASSANTNFGSMNSSALPLAAPASPFSVLNTAGVSQSVPASFGAPIQSQFSAAPTTALTASAPMLAPMVASAPVSYAPPAPAIHAAPTMQVPPPPHINHGPHNTLVPPPPPTPVFSPSALGGASMAGIPAASGYGGGVAPAPMGVPHATPHSTRIYTAGSAAGSVHYSYSDSSRVRVNVTR